MKDCRNFSIGEAEAVGLGIQPVESVLARLHELSNDVTVMDGNMKKLACLVGFNPTRKQEANLLSCEFDSFDAVKARYLIPEHLWSPEHYKAARRRHSEGVE